jgi:hypothetical protein
MYRRCEMTINLTPEIQSQIYFDKQNQYLLNMVESISWKYEYEPEEKESTYQTNEDKKDKPWIKESDYGYNSYVHKKNLNTSLNTESFFGTLSNAGGSVNKKD